MASRRGNKNDNTLGSILDTITSTEHVINEVKAAGLDITESEHLLKQAMEAYQEGDDRKVMFFVKKAEALAKKIWKDYYMKLTEETLSSTRKLIDEVKDAGLEPKEAEDLFRHALELVEQKNFRLAEEYINNAVVAANRTWNESRAKVVSDAIASIHALIMEAKEIGVEVSEAENILLTAITHYKNEEYEIADELVKNAVILSRNSWNDYRANVASEGLSETYNLIMKAKNSGMDISDVEQILAHAERSFEDKAYDEVEEILKKVEIDVKKRMQEARRAEVEYELLKMEKEIQGLREYNTDTSSADELFKQARTMFDDGDYDSVEDYLKVIESLVEDARAHYETEAAAESISSTETMLREIETKVGDTPANEALLATRSLLDKLKIMGESDKTTGGELSEELPRKKRIEESVHSVSTGDDGDTFEWGATYLCREPKSQKSFNFYLNLLTEGVNGLCISRMHPDKLHQKYKLKESTIWLSKLPCDTCRNPSNLGKLAFTINQFLDKNPGSAVLLDGLEYLINNNDFQMVLRFIDDIHESIVVHESIFIVPVSPASYNEKELTLLERNALALTDNIENNTQKYLEKHPIPGSSGPKKDNRGKRSQRTGKDGIKKRSDKLR